MKDLKILVLIFFLTGLLPFIAHSQRLVTEKVIDKAVNSQSAGYLSDGYYYNLVRNTFNCHENYLLLFKNDSLLKRFHIGFGSIEKITESNQEIVFYLKDPDIVNLNYLYQFVINKLTMESELLGYYLGLDYPYLDYFSESTFDISGEHILFIDRVGNFYYTNFNDTIWGYQLIVDRFTQYNFRGKPIKTKIIETIGDGIGQVRVLHITTGGIYRFMINYGRIENMSYRQFDNILSVHEWVAEQYLIVTEQDLFVTNRNFQVLHSVENRLVNSTNVFIEDQKLFSLHQYELTGESNFSTGVILTEFVIGVDALVPVESFDFKSKIKEDLTPLLRGHELFLFGTNRYQHLVETFDLNYQFEENSPNSDIGVTAFRVTELNTVSSNPTETRVKFEFDFVNRLESPVHAITGFYFVPTVFFCLFTSSRTFLTTFHHNDTVTVGWTATEKFSRTFHGDSITYSFPCFFFAPLFGPVDSYFSNNIVCPRVTISNPLLDINERDVSPLSVWPTPFADNLYFQSKDININFVTLLDMNGRILAKYDINCLHEINEFAVSEFPSGMYFLQAWSCDQSRSPIIKKVLKQ